MDKANKQRGRRNKNENNAYTQNQVTTITISWTNNEKGRLRKSNPHRAY